MASDSKLRFFGIVLCALSLACAGCRSDPKLGQPAFADQEKEPPHLEPRNKVDRQTGKVLREWTVLVYVDRPPQKQGVETAYYPNGAKEWTHEFDHGQSKGAWRSWYRDGKPQSETFFGDPDVDTIMTWWYPSGHIQSRGASRNGVRRGLWRFYYKNGQIAEEGQFFDNQKHGEWRAWSEDGTVITLRKYVKGARVSEKPAGDLATAPSASSKAPTIVAPSTPRVAPPPPEVPKLPDDPDADERPPK